jgi:hypothetical protein
MRLFANDVAIIVGNRAYYIDRIVLVVVLGNVPAEKFCKRGAQQVVYMGMAAVFVDKG